MRFLHDVSAETRHVLQRLYKNAVRGGEEQRACGEVRTSKLESPPTCPSATEHLDATVWKVTVVVFLGSLMTQLDATVVNVSLSTMRQELHASMDAVQWIISGYLLALALTVPLDSVLIEQVLINVLDNALKYTPPGSPLSLAAWTTDGAMTVEVADQGPGLPPGAEQRVFDKFYRAQRPGASSGAGLGLTICRGIIAAHGGQIWVENRSGGGTAFRFTLPLAGTPPDVVTELETASAPPSVPKEP